MAEKLMSDYLSAVTADYTATELSVTPQNVLTERGQKEQIIHKFSDGQRGVVTLGDGTSDWEATLQWDFLSAADEGTIKDLWHDTDKANGFANTFYWQHPLDDETYTVRFLSEIETVQQHKYYSWKAIKQIRLQILGVKP